MLVSEEYTHQLRLLHQEDRLWGTGPRKAMPRVGKFIYDNQVREFVDYGCGKGEFMRIIFPCRVHSYDPGIERWSADPPCAPYLICMDVLEHIEPDKLDITLEHIASKFTKKALATVATDAARHILPDGRNAHLIQEPVGWWIEKLKKYFFVETIEFNKDGNSFVVTLSKHS